MKPVYVTDEEKQIRIKTLSNITRDMKIFVPSLAVSLLMFLLVKLGGINSETFMGIFVITEMLLSFIIVPFIPLLIYEIMILFVHKKKIDAFLQVIIGSFFASYFILFFLCNGLIIVLNKPLNFLPIDPIQFIFIAGTFIGFLWTCIRLPKEAKRVDKEIEEDRLQNDILKIRKIMKEVDEAAAKRRQAEKQTKSSKRKKKE